MKKLKRTCFIWIFYVVFWNKYMKVVYLFLHVDSHALQVSRYQKVVSYEYKIRSDTPYCLIIFGNLFCKERDCEQHSVPYRFLFCKERDREQHSVPYHYLFCKERDREQHSVPYRYLFCKERDREQHSVPYSYLFCRERNTLYRIVICFVENGTLRTVLFFVL